MVDTIQQLQRHRLQVRALLHQWRDGTQHGIVCQTLRLLYKLLSLKIL